MFAVNPTSRAKQHIKDIRKDFDLRTFGPSRHVTNLERALHLLSDQLYQKPTHFWLELIQNADDNDYENNNPTITFTYTEPTLRIDCNEKGFSKDNVNAICQIGQSTKIGNTGTTRYIGEKGIGFKSVFKVADKVWIASNGYTFKFDKSQPLGMIAPIWEAFPQPTVPGVTSMLLEILSPDDQTRLVAELKSLDTRMLIFLQKLREINVRINRAGHMPWTTSLKKNEKGSRGTSKIMLTQDAKEFTYTVTRHAAENMPADSMREGQKRSEILLAFPTTNKQEKDMECQQVYAFLPIRDYGFKFLLQGDFLLSASREDILGGSHWNKALRYCFEDAFVGLIKNGHESFLRYNWPLFLPVDSLPHDFFESTRTSIIQRLSQDLVVRNLLNSSSLPRNLMQVPEQFRTKAGPPLLAFKSTSSLLLSDQYTRHCLEPLEKLGVRKMELDDFVKTLQEVFKADRKSFQDQSSDWHSEFARNLLAACWKSDADRSQWKLVRELPIIPLEENGWISAARSAELGAFLPPESEGEMQFEGIDIKLISKEAASDQSRASLYRYLEIPIINQLEICYHVAKSLCREDPLPQTISAFKLITQTLFLFKAGWRNPSGQDMWFQSQAGGIARGSRLYIKSSSTYSASHYFDGLEFFLSENYFDAVQKASLNIDDFRSWLQDCLHIWEIPRLLSVLTEPGKPPRIEIPWEFNRLTQTRQSPSWTHLLRDNFRSYALLFDLEEVLKHKFYARKLGDRTKFMELEHKNFVCSIGRLKVKCIGGQFVELKETYLPHESVKEDTDGRIPLIDVTDPEHTDWQYLKRFGLGTEPDLKMYLRCLEKLSLVPAKRLVESEIDSKVTRYLDQIQARYTEDTAMVKQHFTQKATIKVLPINSMSDYRWLRSIDCLWKGGDCFRILPVLKRHYPGNETLFHKVLGCGEAMLVDLFYEATCIRLGDDLEHIIAIFKEVEKRLREKEKDPNNYFSQFGHYEIFPIASCNGVSSSKDSYGKLCKIQTEFAWYIADRENLRRSFENLVPLLAFSVGTIRHLRKVMERMELDRYRLSRNAQSRAETSGTSVLDQTLTQQMLRRVAYILRLIPIEVPMETKRLTAQKLRSLKVFTTDWLVQEWSVTIHGQIVQGRPSEANVVFESGTEATLHIYLLRKYLTRSLLKNDIVQQFADFCDIRENTHLLTMALWESLEEVEATFKEYGIADYNPLIDSTEPLAKDDYDIEEPPPEPYNRDKEPFKASDDIPHVLKPQDDADSASEFDEFENAPESSKRFKSKRNRVASEVTGSYHDENEPVMQRTCPHCTAGHIRFAKLELQSILAKPISGKTKVQPTKLPTPQPQPAAAFPGFIRILDSSSLTAAEKTKPHSAYVDESGLQYRGEHFFSNILGQFLGSSYTPNRHWTSVLRTRDGHDSFQGSSATHASFTVPDNTGTITGIMLREHPDLARLWTTVAVTWHFEVKTTAGNLNSLFYLTNAQVDRARAFSTTSLSKASEIPKNVCVLVRVFNIDASDSPEANLYRDPWEMFLTGDVTIKADTIYRCNVGEGPEDPENAGKRSDSTQKNESSGKGSTSGSANGQKPPPPYWCEKDAVKAWFSKGFAD